MKNLILLAISLIIASVCAGDKTCYRYGETKQSYGVGESYNCDPCNKCTCVDDNDSCKWDCGTDPCDEQGSYGQYAVGSINNNGNNIYTPVNDAQTAIKVSVTIAVITQCSSISCVEGCFCSNTIGGGKCIPGCWHEKEARYCSIGERASGVHDDCDDCICQSDKGKQLQKGKWSCSKKSHCQPKCDKKCDKDHVCIYDEDKCECVKKEKTCRFCPCQPWEECVDTCNGAKCVPCKSGCKFNGNNYPDGFDGKGFFDTCNQCICKKDKNGNFNWNRGNNKCKPGCKGHDGRHYDAGWSGRGGCDTCNDCTCKDYGNKCDWECKNKKKCDGDDNDNDYRPTSCRFVNCDRGYKCVESNGYAKCVPVCKYKNKEYLPGESRTSKDGVCVCQLIKDKKGKNRASWCCKPNDNNNGNTIILSITICLRITTALTAESVSPAQLQSVLFDLGLTIVVKTDDVFQFQVTDSNRWLESKDDLQNAIVSGLQNANYQVEDASDQLTESGSVDDDALSGSNQIYISTLFLVLAAIFFKIY